MEYIRRKLFHKRTCLDSIQSLYCPCHPKFPWRLFDTGQWYGAYANLVTHAIIKICFTLICARFITVLCKAVNERVKSKVWHSVVKVVGVIFSIWFPIRVLWPNFLLLLGQLAVYPEEYLKKHIPKAYHIKIRPCPEWLIEVLAWTEATLALIAIFLFLILPYVWPFVLRLWHQRDRAPEMMSGLFKSAKARLLHALGASKKGGEGHGSRGGSDHSSRGGSGHGSHSGGSSHSGSRSGSGAHRNRSNSSITGSRGKDPDREYNLRKKSGGGREGDPGSRSPGGKEGGSRSRSPNASGKKGYSKPGTSRHHGPMDPSKEDPRHHGPRESSKPTQSVPPSRRTSPRQLNKPSSSQQAPLQSAKGPGSANWELRGKDGTKYSVGLVGELAISEKK